MLSILLDARHEDGSPMSDQELRDELMTLLVAGHETTATSLAWAFERLVRGAGRARAAWSPRSTRATTTPTSPRPIQETLRSRPVLPNTAAAAGGEADRGRRVALRAGRRAGRERLPRCTTIPTIYPEPVRVPARALPRRPARHLHVDPVRRRASALPRGVASRCSRCGSCSPRCSRPTRSGPRPRAPRWRVGATSRSAPPTAVGSAPRCASAPPSRPEARASSLSPPSGRVRSRARSRRRARSGTRGHPRAARCR